MRACPVRGVPPSDRAEAFPSKCLALNLNTSVVIHANSGPGFLSSALRVHRPKPHEQSEGWAVVPVLWWGHSLRSQGWSKPTWSDPEPEFLTDTCSPQETFSAFSHPPPPGRPGRLKGGGQRSRGEGAEPPPAIISWPWARRLQAEPVGRRGACCLQKGGSGVEGGPLLGTGSRLCPGLGFIGGRKGKARLRSTY